MKMQNQNHKAVIALGIILGVVFFCVAIVARSIFTTVQHDEPLLIKKDHPSVPGNTEPPDESTLKLQKQLHRRVGYYEFICNYLSRYGNEAGGQELCHDVIFKFKEKDCLVYSFKYRSNNEFSFEDDINEKFGCEVHIFDPSLEPSLEYERKPNMYVHAIGLAPRETKITVGEQTWHLMSLETITAKLGHQKKLIDALRLDIEGSEWEVLQSAMDSGTFQQVKQFSVKLHVNKQGKGNLPLQDEDYQYILATLRTVKLHFSQFFHHNRSQCCDELTNNYHVLSSKLANGVADICCYDLFFVNEKAVLV